MVRLLMMRNVLRHFGNIYSSEKKCSVPWAQIRWWLHFVRKTQSMQCKATLCSDVPLRGTSIQGSIVNSNSDDVVKAPDMVQVKVMPFNLIEGGRYIVDILEKTDVSVAIIFVRSSVLANELVKELNENNLNATEINDYSQNVEASNGAGNSVFVVSDKIASDVSLPQADLVIQVQAPLSGVDVMKERLHAANFTDTFATALLLYNSNDSHFISQLGQSASIISIDPPSFHIIEADEENYITSKNEANLPAIHDNFEKSPAVSRKVKQSLFKPVYPEQSKNKRVGFVDRVRLYVIGGSGGNGSPQTGARGGDGGDVILECQTKVTLRHFRFKENRRAKAAHGQHCCVKAKRVNGKRGDDLIIPVPLGTVIKDETSGRVFADMDEVGQRLNVVEGGRGGSPSTVEGGGEKGKRKMIVLEYKMNTDVGLVGFPNAGKSTLLRALSNAKPKVAEYAFTSLQPTLGRVEYEDFSQLTVADLPGLLEGAHQNKGLGLKFLRHVERAKLLLFVVDVNGFQLSSKYPKRTAVETISLLARELVSYKENLIGKPKVLVINKMDCVGAEDEYRTISEQISDVNSIEKLLPVKELPENNNQPVPSINFDNLHVLKEFKFDHVLPASALKQTGIEDIVSKLRELMIKNEEIIDNK